MQARSVLLVLLPIASVVVLGALAPPVPTHFLWTYTARVLTAVGFLCISTLYGWARSKDPIFSTDAGVELFMNATRQQQISLMCFILFSLLSPVQGEAADLEIAYAVVAAGTYFTVERAYRTLHTEPLFLMLH